jgi:acetyltransferase-like isoleucine patch superfamily enzyme
MLIQLLHRIFQFLSLAKLRKKWHHVLLSQQATIGNGSFFYESAMVENIQQNKVKIQIGDNTHVRGELLIFPHGGGISIGNYCYIGEGTRIWSAQHITIGNNVLIAHNVNIHDNISHPIEATLRHKHFKDIITDGHPQTDIDLKAQSVLIKDNAWIGFNATILKGTTIGNRAVVGACAVVTKDVPDDAIVVGNPAHIIGYVNNIK